MKAQKNPVFIKVFQGARVAELVDAPDLGSGSLGSEGSIPFARTIHHLNAAGLLFGGNS